ncbi:SEC-C metal-binding domain-containing protein [Candidatus Nitrotoga sp. BS]|uniref:SEC-C metal-binding domain-containing protein n=1 Tax=Candidatus Nitrotoga sp. BS TaxID=2890408 RepID=UPI00403D8C47
MTQSRNTNCNCGSGMRFKHCCGNLAGTNNPDIDLKKNIKASIGRSICLSGSSLSKLLLSQET